MIILFCDFILKLTEHGVKEISDVLSILECSRHGLLELEIIEILSLTSSKWGAINLSLNLFLRSMGKESQLDFFHRQISKAGICLIL
jgi:hypothetical protein